MSKATFIVGDSLTVLRSLADASVDCLITSPPYFQLRSYLPAGAAAKGDEVGQEPSPGDFLDTLLDLMDECWRVLSDDATYWVNLGDTHAGSGGAGGDYGEGGLRDGQNRYDGTARKARAAGITDSDRSRPARSNRRGDWPLDQSVCWTPHLFGASLAYGRNLLTGTEHRQWVTRPAVTWCKPNPMPGATGRKFKTATELILYGGKHQQHYWDVDPVRLPAPPENMRTTWNQNGPKQRLATERSDLTTGHARFTKRTVNDNGKVPLNYWEVSTEPYPGSHFAVFPPDLITKPVIVGCPAGGVVLDPFAGSGTTLAVATGHGRDAIGIDLDARNADLARERVGMFLEVVEHKSEVVA